MADDRTRPTPERRTGQELDDHHVSSPVEVYDPAMAKELLDTADDLVAELESLREHCEFDIDLIGLVTHVWQAARMAHWFGGLSTLTCQEFQPLTCVSNYMWSGHHIDLEDRCERAVELGEQIGDLIQALLADAGGT